MSTGTQDTSSAASPSLPSELQPGDVFDELVYFSRETCSNCFSKIRDVEHIEVQSGTLSTRPETLSFPTDDAVRGWIATDTQACVSRTFCRQCGSESGYDLNDTLSRRKAVSLAPKIAARLRENDIPVDERALRYATKKLKSDERLQGRDREIFARATKLAILHAD